MKIATLILTAAAFIAGTCVVSADSLFPGSSTATKSGGSVVSLFTDNRAHQVGDSLTITIQETASATSSGETKTSKTDNATLGPGIGPILRQLGVFSVSGNGSSDGQGSTTRTDNLTAQITVTVKEVLPNGNLSVEGKRRVGMNAEMQEITLTGIVRPQDVSPSNTVPSALVADAQIKFAGKGPVGDKQREGIISRLFKLVF
jgi:flagellar L-ring protein precursor FlgH